MQMIDQDEEDDKIIAIHEHDPAVNHFRDIKELPEHTLNELQRFFEDYKVLEHKKVRIERFRGRDDAIDVIEQSFRLYDETFPDMASRIEKVEAHEEADVSGRSPSRQARLEAARRQAELLAGKDAESASA
jgi:inorganic pyrophosphatase